MFAQERDRRIIMTSPRQHGIWIFRIRLLAELVGLALASILVLTVGAAEAALAQSFQVIHNFAGGLDGSEPASGLAQDAGGHFYGTTFEADTGTGTVFKLTHGKAGWVLTPLYLFTGGSDGAVPYASVIIGRDGRLYGTTGFGGIGPCQTWNGKTGCGTVFNLAPPARPPSIPLSPWTETVLYRFTGGNDGGNPYGGDLIFDQAGNLYGPAYNGGVGCTVGCGVVFELTPSASGWTERVIHTFTDGGDGEHPWSGLIFDQSGNLYGTTVQGGAYG